MTSRVPVDDVATALLTYPLIGARQLEDGKYNYSLAFYYPEGGRSKVIEQMDSLGLVKEKRHASTVYMGNGFELRVETHSGLRVGFPYRFHVGPVVLFLTEEHQRIYHILETTKDQSHKA